MIVKELEVDRWSLASVPDEAAYRELRSEGISLIWTDFEELGVCILNVLSPRDHALWDVGAFRAFIDGHHRFQQMFIERPSAVSEIGGLIQESGEELRSAYAWNLLGGITRIFGEHFRPRDGIGNDFALSRRQESYMIPLQRRSVVSRYFRSQIASFFDRCVIGVPEDREFVVSDHSRHQRYMWSNLLALPVPALSAESRAMVIGELQKEGVHPDFIELDRDIHVSFGHPGDISISLPFELKDAKLTDDFLRIAKFRLEMALSICSLPALERIRNDLLSVGWLAIDLADLRSDALRRINKRLEIFPDMIVDPFGLSQRCPLVGGK